MKPYAVEYAMMKWLIANAKTLTVLGMQQSRLKRFVEPALKIQQLFSVENGYDVEVLNREAHEFRNGFYGLGHTLSENFKKTVSDLVRELFDSQKRLEEQGSAIFSATGLGLAGLAYVRKDISEQEAGLADEWAEYRAEAEVLFAWQDNDWTVRRFRRSPYFTVKCAAEPVELQTATLREQLDWVRADLAKTWRDIDAIIDDEARWPTEVVVVVDRKSQAEQLAARFLSSVSKEERELLRSEFGPFHERMKTLLKV